MNYPRSVANLMSFGAVLDGDLDTLGSACER